MFFSKRIKPLFFLSFIEVAPIQRKGTRKQTMSHGYKSSSMGYAYMDKKWVFSFVITSLVCVVLIATSFNMGLMTSFRPPFNETIPHFATNDPKVEEDKLPRLAYLVSGSKGDLASLWRTLRALYHPRNQYIVHLDLESSLDERLELASRISDDSMYSKIGNVYMITKANLVTYTGPTMVANTLHACAILLKRSPDWDWFINLSASDYPLVTQDDLLYTFSTLDRNLNFIDHTSDLGWKNEKRAMPLMVDPGLYMLNKADILWVRAGRSLPTAFKLHTGSAWMALSRSFVEYIIWVICNAPEFSKTVVNHDLHYIAWDRPPRQHPRTLSLGDMEPMIASGAPFARKFSRDDSALDKIDKELLMRTNKGGFTPGGWCGGKKECTVVEDVAKIRPGLGAERLKGLVDRLVAEAKSGQNQCE
ncbi:beta-glucuronosyltransferase GlcAT14B isoform X3 [Brassica rapa]|uniref:beta-glucuronosyltransferase GlcAT14B isoform X3 n=1 Tax=Brassica campestris TaxID=3711 RepID=UPI00142D411F|nr:beta-glucuronosyltransferase GlcAT14B isoform X3 [Brassica rapa]